MKWFLVVLGILLLVMGTVWILQGTGAFPVGFMAYDPVWTYAGAALDLFGIGLLVLAVRRKR